MYNVSQDYITAINKPAKFRRLTGKIGTVNFSDDNIAEGSFKIEHQCTGDSEVQIGTVYMAVLTATFRNLAIESGGWRRMIITPSEGLKLADGTFEDIPLGRFTIYEANHQDDGVAVMAYDNMKKLDKKFVASTTVGTPYDYLLMIQSECRIILAQTENEIRALPNGTKAYTLYAENDIETFRDLCAWVAQTLCAFATIDRQGRLEIRQYKSIENPVDTIDADKRWQGSSFSDFETYYTGVSVTKIEDETTKYIGEEVDDGLTYNLGPNPLLQSGNIETSLQEILEGLQTIHYTPFVVTRNCMPAYDLGDVLEFEDGNGEGKIGCLMSYEYTYHGSYRMEGIGSNPALMDARSKTDKEISGLMRQNTVANQMQYYTYENIKAIDIGEDYKEIIYIRFGSMKQTIVTLHVEIKLDAINNDPHFSDSFVKVAANIKYIFNGEELAYHPQEIWFEGTHLLHLLYYFPIDEANINRLSVRMNTDNSIHIDRYSIRAVLSGQGLVASSAWDGVIECEDTVYSFEFSDVPDVIPFEEEVEAELHDVITISFEENVDAFDFNTSVDLVSIHELLQINKQPISDYTWDEIGEYTWDEVEDMFYW